MKRIRRQESFYKIFIIFKQSRDKVKTMQLQQSTFALYKMILFPIPKALLLVLSVVTFLLIIVNFSFIFRYEPVDIYQQCLNQYYKATRVEDIEQFIDRQYKEGKNHSTNEVNNYLSLTNSSSLLRIEQSIDPEETGCRI